MGCYTLVSFYSSPGATTWMKNERPHLLVVHCVSHRLELAMKDAFEADDAFQKVSDTLFTIWNTFRKSGKLKRLLKKVAQIFNIQVVSWVKSNGTRFQNHKVIFVYHP